MMLKGLGMLFARASLPALFAGALGASTALACESWKQLFVLKSKETHLAAVMAGRGDAWIAGGIGIVVEGDGQAPHEQALPGSAVEAFGVGPDRAIYAVGAQGAIWKRSGFNAWQEEHRTRPAGSKGTRKFKDLLIGVRAIPHQSGIVLFAYGPGGTPSLVRDEHGSWKPPPPDLQQQLLGLAISGPTLELPRDCRRDRWRWLDGSNGVAFCDDGRAFAWLDGKVVAAGKAPKACDFVTDVVMRGQELYACCGREGHVFVYAGTGWNLINGVENIFALSANERCVVAASDRAVWQHCLGSEERSHGVPDASAVRK